MQGEYPEWTRMKGEYIAHEGSIRSFISALVRETIERTHLDVEKGLNSHTLIVDNLTRRVRDGSYRFGLIGGSELSLRGQISLWDWLTAELESVDDLCGFDPDDPEEC